MAAGDSDNLTATMEHLACFVPGNLALGVEAGAVSGAKAAAYLELASDLAGACFEMYAQQPSGAHLTLSRPKLADPGPARLGKGLG